MQIIFLDIYYIFPVFQLMSNIFLLTHFFHFHSHTAYYFALLTPRVINFAVVIGSSSSKLDSDIRNAFRTRGDNLDTNISFRTALNLGSLCKQMTMLQDEFRIRSQCETMVIFSTHIGKPFLQQEKKHTFLYNYYIFNYIKTILCCYFFAV